MSESEADRPPNSPPAELPLWKEFIQFILENKAWWLIPIALVLALIGVLAVLTSTGAAPFIYPVF